MAANANFMEGFNGRNKYESIFRREHISINDLKMRDEIEGKRVFNYIQKTIPCYPSPIEFHLTEVAHVTNKTSLLKIWDSEGFKGLDKCSLSWWSLKINDADIEKAEERYLDTEFPDRSEEDKEAQQPFLKQFTTSPLFLNQSSRYGNFRFTLPLSELMEAYKKQNCEGEEPVLRVIGTKIFKQEIEYVVFVHSPQLNEKLKDIPLLTRSPFVAYDGNQIIWKAQAICETHNFQMEISGNRTVTEPMRSHQFYVWDQVSFAFYIPEGLIFPKRKLKASLSCCEMDPVINLSHGENCSSIEEAERVLESLTDDEFEKEDEKEEQISEKIKMEED